ncbi:hypothetical protein VTJ83DRAFT_933 [Remersonia thermophila]|uniref:Uncharacterized protein n=1 Tax=Remersonia thermophila TaxID=72144 RepID=A0ABR4DP69_9PEZI
MTESPSRPQTGRSRTFSGASSTLRRLSKDFAGSRPPEGLMAVTGEVASSVFAPPRTPLEGNALATIGSRPDGARQPAAADPEKMKPLAAGDEPRRESQSIGTTQVVSSSDEATLSGRPPPPSRTPTQAFPNGYHFPPRYPWQETVRHGLKAFWAFFVTPMGFFWTLYGLNVVAWGGMLFLLLCNAAPAMCYPTCDDVNSPRRKWIEWDAQILTALFCVTAFGLAPWRFRDLYYLLRYRVRGQHDALRRLAGIHNGWFRLAGTQDLPPDVGPDNVADAYPPVDPGLVPIPEKNMPQPPLTGTRAAPTAVWKLDLVIWSMVMNTFAQCALCGIMWGMNRHNRPSWATGFLVAIACIIAMVGGLVTFLEGRRVKSVEGVPLSDRDREKLARDKEMGIPHYNNLKDKKPKEKKAKGEKEGK